MRTLRPYQTEAVNAIEEHWKEWQRELLVLPTGCHHPEQGILMYDGSIKKAKNIIEGDKLMSPTGEPRTVLSTHRGLTNMFDVFPTKGDSFCVTYDHVLPLVHTNMYVNPKYPCQQVSGRVDCITVIDYINSSRNFKRLHKLFRSEGIDHFDKARPITEDDLEPYFVGILLGDGGGLVKGKQANITTPDKEIKDYIFSLTDKYELTYRFDKAGKADMIFFKSKLFREKLERAGIRLVCEDKHIPDLYKLADRKNRLEVLAGLLDTDGGKTDGGYDFISKSRQLSEDVAFICRSVGLAAYVKSSIKSSQYGTKGEYWRVSISGDCSVIPCKVAHKICHKRKQKKSVLRTGIKEVKPIGIGMYCGFTVDGDNLYLMDDFTVTHNCGKTIVFNEIAHQRKPGVLILAGRDELIEQARDKYFKAYGEVAGKIKAEESTILPVTVGSVQTVSRRTYAPDTFDTIIIDEAHHSVSDSYMAILKQFPNAKVLGVSATVDRGDKKSLAKVFDGIAYEYSIKQAVEQGYLCKIVARTVPLNIDLTDVKISVGDFEVNSLSETLEPYLPQIAQSIKEYASDRKTVVFLPLIHIAQEFAEELRKVGLDAREVNGGSPDRKETLEWFDKAPKGSVLTNAMLVTEGWDCPSVDCVVILRPTKVRSLAVQMWGRGTRLFPGKENLLILDFLWQTYKFNLCRPASLASDNDEDIKRVVKKTTEKQLDLFDAVTDAEEARKNALAEALRKQTKKKSRLVNPFDLFDILDDIGLADYEPTFEWENADASQKQIECLANFGIDAEGITKGYACKIMDTCISRSKHKMATIKQVRTLKKFGYHEAPKWTFEQANKKISQLAACGWKKWRVRD